MKILECEEDGRKLMSGFPDDIISELGAELQTFPSKDDFHAALEMMKTERENKNQEKEEKQDELEEVFTTQDINRVLDSLFPNLKKDLGIVSYRPSTVNEQIARFAWNHTKTDQTEAQDW